MGYGHLSPYNGRINLIDVLMITPNVSIYIYIPTSDHGTYWANEASSFLITMYQPHVTGVGRGG